MDVERGGGRGSGKTNRGRERGGEGRHVTFLREPGIIEAFIRAKVNDDPARRDGSPQHEWGFPFLLILRNTLLILGVSYLYSVSRDPRSRKSRALYIVTVKNNLYTCIFYLQVSLTVNNIARNDF